LNVEKTGELVDKYEPNFPHAFTFLNLFSIFFPGVPNLIRADMVKPGACVIDVGITRIHDKKTGKSKLVGDVDFNGEYRT
jgi:hypothetical protein